MAAKFPVPFARASRLASPLLVAGLTLAQSLPPLFNKPREFDCVKPHGELRSLRVVTWNIDHGANLDRITAALKKESADICLFQEVDWGDKRSGNADIAQALARALQLNAAFGIEFEELGQERNGGEHAYTGQATLTRLPVKRTRILRFAAQTNFWKPRGWIPSAIPLTQRRLGNRIALVSDMELNGQRLVVYNTHLESRSFGHLQMSQIDEMLADLKANYPPETAAILGGDLNTKYFPSTYVHKLERQGFRSVTGNRITRTHRIAMALDWIFARGNFRFENAGVRKDVGGSDHFPIYAEIFPSH